MFLDCRESSNICGFCYFTLAACGALPWRICCAEKTSLSQDIDISTSKSYTTNNIHCGYLPGSSLSIIISSQSHWAFPFYNCTPPMDDNFHLLSPGQDFSIILPPDTEILTSGRVWFLMLPLDIIIFAPWTNWISQDNKNEMVLPFAEPPRRTLFLYSTPWTWRF